MNWRSGFNRMFLLGSIFWAGYAMVHPPRRVTEAWEQHEKMQIRCVQQSVQAGPDGTLYHPDGTRYHLGDGWLQHCWDQTEKQWFEAALRGWLNTAWLVEGMYIKPEERNAWLFAMRSIRAFVWPVLAYGLFRLCWLVLAWLLRGFHGVEPQGAS